MLASCAILACLAASLPATATAARATAEFDARGSNGYTAFFAFSGRRASVDAIDTPDPLVLVSAAYFAKGSFEAGGSAFEGARIRARFGSRGRVAVEFRPLGEAKRRLPPRRCEGRPRVRQAGLFVGTIRFTGEGGYTSVDATRTLGTVRTTPRWRCRRGRRAPQGRLSAMPAPGPSRSERLVPFGLDPEAERLTTLDAEADDGRTSFRASATRPRGRSGETTFAAVRLERRPNLTIVRSAFAHGEEEAFTFDKALGTASAAPPGPFAGTADFVRDAGGTVICYGYPCDRSSWLGPLSVDFPGAAGVPLAGKGFHARLFRKGLGGSVIR